MPTSKKQITANRQNAQKSTGPKTETGKQIVSQNAITHGLYSKRIVINSKYFKEDAVEYELLYESLCDELQPETAFQIQLVRKIANCLWRSQRIALAETAKINEQINRLDYRVESGQLQPGTDEYNDAVNLKFIPFKSFSSNLLYYEMRLDRQLTRTYKLLRNLQKKRENDARQREENEKKLKNERNKPISF